MHHLILVYGAKIGGFRSLRPSGGTTSPGASADGVARPEPWHRGDRPATIVRKPIVKNPEAAAMTPRTRRRLVLGFALILNLAVLVLPRVRAVEEGDGRAGPASVRRGYSIPLIDLAGQGRRQ